MHTYQDSRTRLGKPVLLWASACWLCLQSLYAASHEHELSIPIGTRFNDMERLQVDWTIRLIVINSKLSGANSFQGTMETCFGRPGLIAISVRLECCSPRST